MSSKLDGSQLLSCDNVCVKVNDKSLIENISFNIQNGEHRVILGPNGAGKSTLVRALLGFLKLHSGSVSIGGETGLSRRDLARKVAYVPQLLAAEIPYTVEEFVAMGRYAYEGVKEYSPVVEAMRAVGVEKFAKRVVASLSGGERQRVCIAAALAQQAELIIFDEPLVHLDPGQRGQVQSLIRELMDSVSVLVVTHDLEWARRDFSRLLVMQDSQLIYDGETEDFYQNGGIEALFGLSDYVGEEVGRA